MYIFSEYQEQGFLILENFVSSIICDQLRQQTAKLVSEFEPQTVKNIFTTNEQSRISNKYFFDSSEKINFFFEENAFDNKANLCQSKELSINKIGHALHELDSVFKNFSYNNKIARLAIELGLKEPVIIQSMYIFKQPNIGGEVNCHQDSTFLYTEPEPVIGLWFALEDATIENGCLWAIPKAHKLGLKSRFIRATDDTTSFKILDNTQWDLTKLIPLEVKKGSLIVLHGLLPHLSYANKSRFSRHAYTLHLIDKNWHYAKDNWLQRHNLPLESLAIKS
ncbi:MAG: phytanoyl-CoA dioxygenase family protein [Acidobacteria bacterium]|nr:phytanoyl-CoA dioxygenase family protein [Acidobacteriota bacterium]